MLEVLGSITPEHIFIYIDFDLIFDNLFSNMVLEASMNGTWMTEECKRSYTVDDGGVQEMVHGDEMEESAQIHRFQDRGEIQESHR